MFYFDSINGKKILRSDLINDVDAFFTTREVVIEDFTKQSNIKFARPEQTHSDNVELVDKREVYPNTDGLITNKQNTLIFLKFADCTPLIFYDKVNKAGGVSHAGWRGTASKIAVKTVEKMNKEFGTKPENLIVLIGAAISLCCYEVSEDVKTRLLSTVNNSEGLYKDRNVDLKGINSRQLTEIGVKNIDICPYCTSCNNDLFYSYRKENGTKMRHFAVLKL